MVRTPLTYHPDIFRSLYRQLWQNKEEYHQKKLLTTLHTMYWWVGGSIVIGFLAFLHSAFIPVAALGVVVSLIMGVQYVHQRSLFIKKGKYFLADVEEQIERLNAYKQFFLEFDDQTVALWMDQECYRSPWYVYDYMIRHKDYLYFSSIDPKRRHMNVLIPAKTVSPDVFSQLKNLAEKKIENKIEG